MTYITLKSLVDDILLLVRNNNISESEDLSREQIRLWIKSYKQQLIKQRIDQQKDNSDDDDDIEGLIDDIYIKEKGPLELEDVPSLDKVPMFTKRTIEKLEGVYNDEKTSILAIHDQAGENIQYMNHIRRHYNYFRKYTGSELTADYKDGHIYIRGIHGIKTLKYIWVLAVYEEDDDNFDNAASENDVKIPSWMVPFIKNGILKNELPFMLNMHSDDSNNSTLASVKPHGPQDDEE